MKTWATEHEIAAAAAPADVWALWVDVAGWPAWDASIEGATLDGPFAAGTAGTLRPAGMDALPFVLTDVEDGVAFADETRLGPLALRFRHRVTAATGGCRIAVRIEAEGPGAAEVGPMVAADLPESLAALAAAAARRTLPV